MPVISTNLAANSAVRYLNINSSEQTASLSKLASGSRITQASDDAAGLAISTKISSDVTALNQAATNASHGVSVLQTADGGASNISDILQRMKSLASQSSSGTVTDTERAYIEAEFSQLIEEVDGIATGTRYNGQSLLDGSSAFADGISVMVGSSASDTVEVTISTLTAASLGLSNTEGFTSEGADGTAAAATGSSDATTELTFATDGTDGDLVLSIDGSDDITITLDTDYASTTAFLADVNSQLGNLATASFDSNNYLVITSASTGSDSSVEVSGTAATLTALGLTAGTSNGTDTAQAADDIVTTAVSTYDASAADVSFDVNGVTVTLTTDGGTTANGSYTAQDIADAINAALVDSGNTTVSVTNASGVLTFSNSDTGSDAEVTIDNFDGIDFTDLGLASTDDEYVEAGTLSVSTQSDATAAIDAIDAAIDTVSKARANIGALESRFSFRSESIATSIENLEAANSAITDTDVAAESSKLASAKVKTQAAVAAAAQASQMPQDLLKLLQ